MHLLELRDLFLVSTTYGPVQHMHGIGYNLSPVFIQKNLYASKDEQYQNAKILHISFSHIGCLSQQN